MMGFKLHYVTPLIHRYFTLGLPDPMLNAIKPSDGVVYVCGTTGSGKSTLLASIIRDIVEDPDSNRKY